MQNPIANLFLSIQSVIAQLADGSGNLYFKYVDQDLGQLEQERPPVLYPCVLIDVDNFAYNTLGSNLQEAKGQIILRLGFPPFSASSGNTPDAYKQKAVYYYDLEQILHLALQQLNPPNPPGSNLAPPNDMPNTFGKLNRISARTEKRTDFIRVREIIYQIAYEDYSTKYTPTTIPTPVLNLTEQLIPI